MQNAKCIPPTIRKGKLRYGPEDKIACGLLLSEFGEAKIIFVELNVNNFQRETDVFAPARHREVT